MSALLIVSVLSWTVGCTTTKVIRESDSLAQYQDEKIVVRTKDGSRYILSHWTRNASGDYTGTGKHFKGPYRTPFSGTIAADRILTVKIVTVDAGKTILAILGVSAGLAAVFVVLVLAFADFGD